MKVICQKPTSGIPFDDETWEQVPLRRPNKGAIQHYKEGPGLRHAQEKEMSVKDEIKLPLVGYNLTLHQEYQENQLKTYLN